MAIFVFNNVFDLEINSGVEGDIAEVVQVYRGGIFIYRTASTLTPDSGTVFSAPGGGKWVRQERETGHPFNVWWFGAVPDGYINYNTSSAMGTDNTAAFNAATMAAIPYDDAGLNTLTMKREIYIPAGNYNIRGTVYVRKGQHLRGAGYGATRLINTFPNAERGLIVMGEGISGVDATSTGGLIGTPTQISDLMIDSTAVGRTAIRCTSTPGSLLTNLWILNCSRAFEIGGSDVILTDSVFDQNINLGIISGANHLISNCIFYRTQNGIELDSFTFAAHGVQILGCRFEYYREGAGNRFMILFRRGDQVRAINIENCQFDLYSPNPESLGMIQLYCFRAGDVVIRNCSFNNQEGYAIGVAGFSNDVVIDNCSINGTKVWPSYSEASKKYGIYCSSVVEQGAEEFSGSRYTVSNCRFINFEGSAITIAGTGRFRLYALRNSYENLSNTTSGINLSTDPPNSYVLSMNNILYNEVNSVSGGPSVDKNIVSDVAITR